MTTSPAPPLEAYLELTGAGRFTSDPHQLAAIEVLDRLWHALNQAGQDRNGWRQLWRRFTSRREVIRGVYLWGGVGRGKTRLMDLFYESLPIDQKRRIHFHRFMQRVHDELADLGHVSDPLPRVARRWSENTRLLCLDEFFVADIADAMLLSGLLQSLFRRGVTLVTTSNSAPDELYREGLQRAKFLPAIESLKRNCRVVEVGGDTDYRLRILEHSETWHHPLDENADAILDANYERMACGSDLNPEMKVNGRRLRALRRSDGLAWFDFTELCHGPRGSADYIELARSFNTILISNVVAMTDCDSDVARRFITMIDEFYDRNVKLLITSQCPIDALYAGQRLSFEFQRTTSRLTEMQTHEYLARPHLA